MPDLREHFNQLLHENHPRMVRLARQYADADDWQDLLQDMRLQLWLSLPGFDGRAQLDTWVYRVALNTAISHRRRKRLPRSNADAVAEAGDTGAINDEMDVLRDFLGALDPVNRALLLMDLEGMSRTQIAEVLGLSAGNVAVRMTRLRQRFEERYLEQTR